MADRKKSKCLWDIDCRSAIELDPLVCCMKITATEVVNLVDADVVNAFPLELNKEERFCATSEFVSLVEQDEGVYEEAGVKYMAECLGWTGTEIDGATYLNSLFSAFAATFMLYIASI